NPLRLPDAGASGFAFRDQARVGLAAERVVIGLIVGSVELELIVIEEDSRTLMMLRRSKPAFQRDGRSGNHGGRRPQHGAAHKPPQRLASRPPSFNDATRSALRLSLLASSAAEHEFTSKAGELSRQGMRRGRQLNPPLPAEHILTPKPCYSPAMARFLVVILA